MSRSMRYTTAALTVAVFCGAVPSFAQTIHQVDMASLRFTPDPLTIQVGDTVHWVWADAMSHNVVSGVSGVSDGNFNSGTPVMGATYDVTFDQAFLDANTMGNNEYPYYCEVHLIQGMTGTIIVEVPIPAVSAWGLAAMALLISAAAAVILVRRRALYNTG